MVNKASLIRILHSFVDFVCFVLVFLINSIHSMTKYSGER